MSKAYEQALALIRQHGGRGHFAGPQPDETIERAEAMLGVTYPEPYGRFLRELGAGDLAGVEIYGIVDADLDAKGIPNGVWYTLRMRERGLPDDFVVIAEAGDGSLDCLDLGRGGAVAVVDLDPRNPYVEEVAPDFGSYLRDRLEQALADAGDARTVAEA